MLLLGTGNVYLLANAWRFFSKINTFLCSFPQKTELDAPSAESNLPVNKRACHRSTLPPTLRALPHRFQPLRGFSRCLESHYLRPAAGCALSPWLPTGNSRWVTWPASHLLSTLLPSTPWEAAPLLTFWPTAACLGDLALTCPKKWLHSVSIISDNPANVSAVSSHTHRLSHEHLPSVRASFYKWIYFAQYNYLNCFLLCFTSCRWEFLWSGCDNFSFH